MCYLLLFILLSELKSLELFINSYRFKYIIKSIECVECLKNIKMNNFFSSHIKHKKHLELQNVIELQSQKLMNSYNLILNVEFISKKHSSGIIKGGILKLRISNKLPYEIKEKHILSLIKNLTSKYDVNDKSDSKSNIDYFITAIHNKHLLLGDTHIQIKKHESSYIRLEYNTNEIITLLIPQLEYETLPKEEIQEIEKICAKLLCKTVQKKMSHLVKELFSKYIEYFKGKSLGDVSVKYTSSKWGHCTSKDDIMIHISLLNAPLYVLEYVILHELSHIIHKNHSKQFWELCNTLSNRVKDAKLFLKKTPPILWNSNTNS